LVGRGGGGQGKLGPLLGLNPIAGANFEKKEEIVMPSLAVIYNRTRNKMGRVVGLQQAESKLWY